MAPGRRLSAPGLGDRRRPSWSLLHGGAQNAHTWDTVALALDRPLVAVDLPGHGHSDGGAARLALGRRQRGRRGGGACAAWRPAARAVVGMSLGGLTALALAQPAPRVGAPPGAGRHHPRGDRRQGRRDHRLRRRARRSFASFDEILARTVEHNPTRSVSSLRRGILHNAVQREDGTWVWRYARFRPPRASRARPEFVDLWAAVSDAGRSRSYWSAAWPRARWSTTTTRPSSSAGARRPGGAGLGRRPQRPGRPAGRAGPAHRRLRAVGARVAPPGPARGGQ